jgi:elongation factor 2
MSGMGELHLEITEYRIKNEYGVDITSSTPIVVYRESINKPYEDTFEGKSPNKHNRFYIDVKPLPQGVIEAIKSGEISVGKVKNPKQIAQSMQELGLDKTEARGLYYVHGQNIFTNVSKGVQYLNECKELMIEAFIEAMNLGPRAREPVMGVMVRLVDAKLHEDAIHRGPAQVIPAVRQGIYGAMMSIKTYLMEPKQNVFISVPQDMMGSVTSMMQQRRSSIDDMQAEGDMTVITSTAPISELFGFAGDLRSATQGKALWNTEFAGFHLLPMELQDKITTQIRERKGLKPEPPPASYYAG